jgi:hypothetical protein
MIKDRHLAELDTRLRKRRSDEQIAVGLAWAQRMLGTPGEAAPPRATTPTPGAA